MAKKNFRIADNENTRLWRELQVTNPDATKEFTRGGGFKGTQIDPTWRFMRMTEKFGPVGQGWGWSQVGEPVITHDCVFICARAWYRPEGGAEKCFTGEQWGGTEIMRKRRDGTQEPNDECFKMAMTDAVGKCLVQLGLAADVHLGLFDDSKYREEAAAHYREEGNGHATNGGKPKEPPTKYGPDFISKYTETLKVATDLAKTEGDLQILWAAHKDRIKEIGIVNGDAEDKIIRLFQTRKKAVMSKMAAG